MPCQLHTSADPAPATAPTPDVPPPPPCVPAKQYDELAARLEDERRARAALQHELAAARENIAALQDSLARMKHCARGAASGTSAPRQQSALSYGRGEDSGLQGGSASAPPALQREGSPLSSNGPNRGSSTKELLSDCSEFSGMKKDQSKKKSKPAAGPGSIRKTSSKSKKERATKAKIPGQSRYWTPEEHKLFLEALNQFGHKDLRSISSYVGTRNMTQVRTHSQKYFMRLMREAKRQNPMRSEAADAGETKIAPGNPAQDAGVSNDAASAADPAKTVDPHADKYSVPNTCGMTLLCLVGQDTLTN